VVPQRGLVSRVLARIDDPSNSGRDENLYDCEKLTAAHGMVAELVVHQRLHKRHDQMRSDVDRYHERKLRKGAPIRRAA
jgi:hypothetical protein